MQEALLYDRLDDRQVLCRQCPWRCQIAPGELGRCRVRLNQEGTLFAPNYGLISAAAVEPIERRWIYHLFPGTVLLTLGGWGNNLRCRHRPEPAAIPQEQGKRRFLDAERAISFALERNCRGLGWGYEEPAVWLEYVLDGMKLAKANGLYTAILTNGFISPEALDLLGPYLDAYIVQLLAASAGPYEEVCGLEEWPAILEATAYARKRWNCHLEVHTPLLPGVNQEDNLLRELAGWIRDRVGKDTPWHLIGPEATEDTVPAEELEWARMVGVEAGLEYVYLHRPGQAPTSTLCPSCGQVLIQRQETYYVKLSGIEEGQCSRCGHPIRLQRSIFK